MAANTIMKEYPTKNMKVSKMTEEEKLSIE